MKQLCKQFHLPIRAYIWLQLISSLLRHSLL